MPTRKILLEPDPVSEYFYIKCTWHGHFGLIDPDDYADRLPDCPYCKEVGYDD